MDWLWVLAIGLVILGVVGTLLPMLPGTPLVFAGLLLAAWLGGFAKVSVFVVVIIGLIAALAWGVDFVASIITAKKVGASKQALWGTAIGGFVGIFAGIPGLIIGPAIGAILGEMLTHQDASRATTVGLAAGLGFVLALVVKIVLTTVMLGIFAYAYYQ
ncbi:MAG: DUF456 domain-containing protein [Methylotenera sp.]